MSIPEDNVKSLAQPVSKPSMREMGATTVSRWGMLAEDDYNQDLRWPLNIAAYDQMRRGDGQVRGTLRLVKAPILSAQWYVEAASDDPADQRIARFVEWNLANMSRTFTQVLWEAMLCLDFGFYAFEKVFEMGVWKDSIPNAKPMRVVKWKKLAPRHPKHVAGWEFDRNGGVKALKFAFQSNSYVEVDIPVEKLLLFVFDEEGGNPQGISILRSAYKHWYYKENLYKIDAIQKERHGIGVPKIVLPPGFDDKDKEYAAELGKNLRTNENAFIVQPPGWDVSFVQIPTNPANALESAEHHDLLIARNVLAQFLNIGSGSAGGGRSMSSAQQDIFMKALRYTADFMRGVFNQYAIPQLVDYNFRNITSYPELKVRRIGDTADLRALSVAVLNLKNAGIITPTPELESWLSEQMDFPSPTSTAMERTIEERLLKPGYETRAPSEGRPTDA